MTFGFVPPPFGVLWADIRRLLDKAVRRGGNDWSDVQRELGSGRAQLWLTVEHAPINATVTRMDGKTLEIWLCGGRVLPDALRFLDTILNAASEDGATDARIVGRRGWARTLAPRGWRVVGDELVKELA